MHGMKNSQSTPRLTCETVQSASCQKVISDRAKNIAVVMAYLHLCNSALPAPRLEMCITMSSCSYESGRLCPEAQLLSLVDCSSCRRSECHNRLMLTTFQIWSARDNNYIWHHPSNKAYCISQPHSPPSLRQRQCDARPECREWLGRRYRREVVIAA